jgi:ectoine hydroxylase-related dioxygenase (phytanoyl-CoA dioxygenase family)
MNATRLRSTDPIAAAYECDGFWIASSLLAPAECERLKQEARRVLREHARPTATVYVGVAVVSSIFYQLADDPRIVAILRAILPTGVMFLSDKLVFKSPQATFASPWHIDAAYWPNTRPKLSVWIPLDDARADNGTLTVVRGSHRREWRHEISDGRDTNGEFPNIIRDRPWAASDEIVCNVPRGSAIFFSDRLVHGSCPNTAGADRFTIISTYHAPAPDEPFDLQFAARHVIP